MGERETWYCSTCRHNVSSTADPLRCPWCSTPLYPPQEPKKGPEVPDHRSITQTILDTAGDVKDLEVLVEVLRDQLRTSAAQSELYTQRLEHQREAHRRGIDELKNTVKALTDQRDALIQQREDTKYFCKDIEIDVINNVAKKMYQIASDHGFHEGDEKFVTISGLVDVCMSTYISNIHGEVSELWEAFRKDTWHKQCDKHTVSGVPIGLTCAEEELADIVIRCMDTAVAMNIQLGRAIQIKATYNSSRSYRHGGKKA